MTNRIFMLMILSVLLIIIDLYIYKAVSSSFSKWTLKKQKVFRNIFWTYSALILAGVFVSIYFNIRLTARAIILVAFFLTFVTKACFLLFLFLDDLRRGATWLKRKLFAQSLPQEPNSAKDNSIPRSEFLVKAGTLVAAIPFASLTYGIASGAYDYTVVKQKLVLPNLPRSFEGMTLAQISDIHSGSFYNRKAVLGGVEKLLAQKPDMIFFTGDMVNNLASEMRDYQDIFSKMKAPLGVFSVLGNHDYGDYHFGKEPSAAKTQNLIDIKLTHKNMGWDLLLNENRKVKINGEEIAIVGIENWGAGRFVRHGRLDLAVKGTDDTPVKFLLSHDPSHWRAQVIKEYPQIDAMFSGHTHGMQFGVRMEELQWSPVQYIYPEWAGLYQEADQQLYVNVGYGFLGYPGRVGIQPEITIFELSRS
ncbi:MAG TPA: metallophosphoesterase [Daejeonella sp.]|nr:metallophosphoesterase [Daejeonella sp.]